MYEKIYKREFGKDVRSGAAAPRQGALTWLIFLQIFLCGAQKKSAKKIVMRKILGFSA